MPNQSDSSPGNELIIQPASWRDLSGVQELERLCFSLDAWPLLDVIGVLTLPGVIRLKAILNDELVGFIAADIRRSEGMAWIATIAVHPTQRGRGIASALLQACEEQLDVPRIRLTVRQSNLAAINLYKKFGYAEADIWQRYYKGGEDGLVMEKLFSVR